jgi:hypothetical protein
MFCLSQKWGSEEEFDKMPILVGGSGSQAFRLWLRFFGARPVGDGLPDALLRPERARVISQPDFASPRATKSDASDSSPRGCAGQQTGESQT